MPEPEQGIEPGDNAMSLNPGSRGVLGRIVLVCGAITAGAGALILVGWAIGSDALTAMGTGYISAPNTALLFVLLGSAVLVREARPASRVIHRIATAAAVFSAVMGSVTLIGFVIGLNTDDWLFSTARMLGEVPMGHMSPVAAFSFVLAGGSLLLLECQARTWAAISGTLIMLAGAVCLMGYWFGAPLLYGGTVIPVALPTSLALVALGVGLTAAAGPDTWPLSALIGPSTRARLLRALLPTVVLLALINSWITAILLEHSDPGVVLASAMTAISFLLVVGFVVSRVSRAVGDAIDRTEAELTHAVDALRESEARFRTIASHTPDHILMQDRDLRYSFVVNPQLGLTEADMIGKTDRDFLGKEDAEKLTAIKRKVLETGESVHLEASLQNPKGETEFFEGAYIPKFDSTAKADGLIGYFRNITKRKRAEDALTHSRDLMRYIIEHDRSAIAVHDRDLKYVYVSQRYLQEYKVKERDVIGKHHYDVFPDLPQKWRDIHQKALAGEISSAEDDPYVREDGTVDWTHWECRPWYEADGSIGGIIIYTEIVTERKRREQALRESEHKAFDALQLNSKIMNTSSIGILTYKKSGQCILANAAAAKVAGTTDAELLAQNFHEIPSWKKSGMYQAAIRALDTGIEQLLEVHLATTFGKDVWLSLSFSSFDSAGERHLLVFTSDITERKQAEETLRETLQRLKFHAENSPLAVVEFDREFRVIFWSDVAQRVFGWSAEEILGKRIDQLRWVHEEDAARVAALGADMFAGRGTRNVYTNRNYHKDGSVIICEWYNSALIDSTGNLASVLSLIVDITERKQAEQALHDNAKRLRNLSRRLIAVEETERRKINRELHDRVGASLSALNLNLSIVRSQLPRESLRAVGARLDDTQRLLEETTTHVRDVMADLHPPALDDYGLLAALRTYVESLGARFAVPISVHGKPFVPRLPLAAETALFRVAQGALVNAVTHAQAKRIEILLVASADRVTLTIADDGIGFDVAQAAQAHASWGLAIMRERSEAVGAELSVESTPGKGTRVCVEIPREKR